MNALSKALVVAIAGFVGLGMAEETARLVMPAPSRHFVYPPGTVRVSTPDPQFIAGVAPVARFVVNHDGIRGDDFAPGQYRILAIGGSTTELLYNDTPNTWTDRLQRQAVSIDGKPLWVGNVGRSGHALREHALQFDYLTREYPNIDAVTVLAGINDAALAMAGAPLALSPDERLARAFGIFPDPSPIKRLALYRLARTIRAAFQPRGPVQDSAGRWMADARKHRLEAPHIDTVPNVGAYLDSYRTDLLRIVTMARERNIRLLLLTQPALVRADNTSSEDSTFWFGAAEVDAANGKAASRYYTARVVAAVLAQFNAVTRAVCRESGVTCVELAVPSTTAMFYDDVHFTDAGAAEVARQIATALSQAP